MNKIACRVRYSMSRHNDVREMTKAYREGALAARLGLYSDRNPYEATGNQPKEQHDWNAGHSNELACEHIRFGRDLISVSPRANKVFKEDPEVPRRSDGSVDPYWYTIERMRVTGLIDVAKRIRDEQGWLTPAKMRDALKLEGHEVSKPFAQELSSRVAHEERTEGRPLTDEEEEIVRELPEPRRRLVVALADVQDIHFHTMAEGWRVSHRCGRSPSWAAATAAKMEKDGQGFLVSYRRNGYCTLTDAGWTAARILRELAAREKADAEKAPSPRP